MSDLPPPTGDWSGSAALVAALGAAVAAVFRRGASMHKVRDMVNTTVGPLGVRVAVLEEQHREVRRQLDSIERKLDRVLEDR